MRIDFGGLSGVSPLGQARKTQPTERLLAFAQSRHDAAAELITSKAAALQALAAKAVRDFVEVGNNQQTGLNELAAEITTLEAQHDFWALAIAELSK